MLAMRGHGGPLDRGSEECVRGERYVGKGRKCLGSFCLYLLVECPTLSNSWRTCYCLAWRTCYCLACLFSILSYHNPTVH